MGIREHIAEIVEGGKEAFQNEKRNMGLIIKNNILEYSTCYLLESLF